MKKFCDHVAGLEPCCLKIKQIKMQFLLELIVDFLIFALIAIIIEQG